MHPISQRDPALSGASPAPAARAPSVPAAAGAAAPVPASKQRAVAVPSPSYKLSLSAEAARKAGRSGDEDAARTTPARKAGPEPKLREPRDEIERQARQDDERRRAKTPDNVRWALSDDRSAMVLSRTDHTTQKVTTVVELKLLGASKGEPAPRGVAMPASTATAGPAGATTPAAGVTLNPVHRSEATESRALAAYRKPSKAAAGVDTQA